MADENISEAASEKPKRGRPPVMSGDLEKAYRTILAPEKLKHASKRYVHDYYFAMKASNVLVEFSPGFKGFEWLICDGNDEYPQAFRVSLLAELGRLQDAETIIEAAKVLCRDKPAVKDAIRRVRAFRTGRKPKPDKVKLANILVDIVNRYRDETGCDWSTALAAIELMKEACESAADE